MMYLTARLPPIYNPLQADHMAKKHGRSGTLGQ
jgi:hypothetical protein